jgi:hypothetical protein
MDGYRPEHYSWDSLCDECAGILRVKEVSAGPPHAYAVTCELHGLVGMMTRAPRN